MLRNIATLILLVWSTTAMALTVDTPLPDAAHETRARALFYEIRCTVCQGESIADSPAGVASDMRRFVRERIAAGESNEVIIAYLVSHYGDYILMQPPLKPATYALWFGPALLLLLGIWAAWRIFHPKRMAP